MDPDAQLHSTVMRIIACLLLLGTYASDSPVHASQQDGNEAKSPSSQRLLFSKAELTLDLEPLFFHPAAMDAAFAFEANRPAEALRHTRRALRGPIEAEERGALLFLEALALSRTGDTEGAFDRFGELHQGLAPPGLDVQAAWHHARLGLHGYSQRAALEAPSSIFEAIELLPLNSRNGSEAWLWLSRRLLLEGETDAACKIARDVVRFREGLQGEAPAKMQEARCLEVRARRAQNDLSTEDAGRLYSEAAAVYREIATRWSDLETGAAARKRLASLERAGIRPAPVDNDALLASARRIADRRGPRTTLSALVRLRRLMSGEERYGLDLIRAETATRRRHFNSARRLYVSIRQHAKDEEIRALGALGLEALRARRAPRGAADRYLALASTWPKTEAALEALARAGEIAWRLGNGPKAMEAFELCLGSHVSDTNHAVLGRCRFGMAWALWHAGETIDAIALLAPSASEDEKAAYWKARLLKETGENTTAIALFQELSAKQPLSYYSLLAQSWLAEELGTKGLVDSKASSDDRATHPDILAAETFSRMGITSEARALLNGIERDGLSVGDRRLASRLLHYLGETSRAIRMAPMEWDGGLPRAPVGKGAVDAALAYPRAFAHAVESEHRHPAVPKTLLYALIRAESAFDPNARSHARALGLTQVIPPTAFETARRIGLRPFRFNMLTNPEVSVHVGSAYLAWLLDRYDGSVPLAIAAYNAGEGAVDRWLDRWGHLPLDAFLEEVPFSETHRYTRRVITFWAIYRALYEDPKEPYLHIRFDLPSKAAPPTIATYPIPLPPP